MYAMQYANRLPADYEMGRIRRRVAERGASLDRLHGLKLKAYLIRERGLEGAIANEYSPFYIWNDLDAMTNFLWGGGGFAGLASSFGRPCVKGWPGVRFIAGSTFGHIPCWATKREWSANKHEDLESEVSAACTDADRLCRSPILHSVVIALDHHDWTFVRFSLWDERPPADEGPPYSVLHLSTPGLA
jgi:hypothetical protein